MNVVTELVQAILKLKPKIIAIAECPLENGDWIHFEGFTCYAETHATKYGCAVYIKNEYVHMFVVERITPQYITLWIAGTEITFPYQRPQAKDFDPNNEWHQNSSSILIGDLNAKHTTWSAGPSNPAGNKLKTGLTQRNMEVRNPHVITHPHSGSHPTGSSLDLATSSYKINLGVTLLNIPSGDHLALSITSGIQWRECTDRPLRYDKANWDMIRAELLWLDNKQDDSTTVQRSLTEIVLRHTRRARFRAKAFRCDSLNQKKRAIRSLIKKRPQDPELPALKREYRKAIAQAKLKANTKALQEETDPECFRTIKARQTRHPIPALQKVDAGIAAEHPHIAPELQDALYGGEHRRASTRIRAKAGPLNTSILNAAIRQSPNGAAPVPDHITTRLIKKLCRLREDLFLRTMNKA